MKTRYFALMALVLGMASCQKDMAPAESRGEVAVSLSVTTPELGVTRAGVDGENDGINGHDSAYGAIDYLSDAEWANVADLRYSLEVYDATDLTAPIKDRMVIIKDKYEPVKFDLRLIPNREYQFVIFADFVPEGAADVEVDYDNQANLGLRHTIGDNLTQIAVKVSDENGDLIDAINDELADAYFKTFTYEPTNKTQNNINDTEKVILQRPYAKVRVIATDLADLNLNVDPKSVEVTYSNVLVPTTFNAVTGKVGTETSERTFNYNYVANIRDNHADHVYNAGYDALKATADNGATRDSHLTLFTDYILAGETQHAVSFEMTVKDQDGTPIKYVDFNTDIPVQRNHLTTIIGTVLTAETQVTVKIDDNFANEYVEPYEIPYLGEEAKDAAAVTYEGDAFASGYMQNALWFNNYYFGEDAAIVIENETYNAIILENCIGKFKNDVITVKNDNSCVMILQNLDFTLAEGKKLIKSVNPYYQVFMANIKINGELMTQESMAQYLENVAWYQVVEEI
ncbi:MAG: hypothetical protein IKW47_02475 [Alistipes sp.]|nr:hypothetical protein [Alistipes sp.]